jgi:hypothetical protein
MDLDDQVVGKRGSGLPDEVTGSPPPTVRRE